MRYEKYYRTRVAKGSKLLDEKRPSWPKSVAVFRLSIENCYECVLGQLYGDYEEGMDHLFGDMWVHGEDRIGAKYGFDINSDHEQADAYAALDELWKQEIQDRRRAARA